MNSQLTHFLRYFSVQLSVFKHTLQFFFFDLQLFWFCISLFNHKLKFPFKIAHFSFQIDNQLLLVVNNRWVICLQLRMQHSNSHI